MNFGSLREAVISFSNFLVGHLLWFGLTVWSIYCAYGEAFTGWLTGSASQLNSLYVADSTEKTLKAYNLLPLVPALCAFVAVFLLHANVVVARRIGQYVPPSFYVRPDVGFRSVRPEYWVIALERAKKPVEFRELKLAAQQKFFAQLEVELNKEHHTQVRSSLFFAFSMFKFYAILNVALILVAPFTGGAATSGSMLLVVGAAGFAVASAFIRVFGELQMFDGLALQAIHELSQREDAVPTSKWSEEKRADAMREASKWRAWIRKRSIVQYGWDIPLFGSVDAVVHRLGKLRELYGDPEPNDSAESKSAAGIWNWLLSKIRPTKTAGGGV